MFIEIDPADHQNRNAHVAVIINPASSIVDPGSVQSKIEEFLTERRCTVDFYYTSAAFAATSLAETAIARGSDLIIAAGGDGTIMEIVNVLAGGAVPLGIVPLGTGNLLAINLGIPMTIGDALDVALNGRDRAIDLVRVNNGEHYFAIMGGIGFDAKVMDDTERSSKQRFGRLAYVWTAVNNLEGQLFDAKISIDGGAPMLVEAKSILIANMGFLGVSINAFPEAVPDDGIMQVGILKASNAGQFARLVAEAVISGVPSSDPTFEVHTCQSVTIQLPTEQLFEYDGDIVGLISNLNAEIEPKALLIRTPKTV